MPIVYLGNKDIFIFLYYCMLLVKLLFLKLGFATENQESMKRLGSTLLDYSVMGKNVENIKFLKATIAQ